MDAVKQIENFQRFGSILGLERITSLMDMLGNPQDDLKVIHVAGTNGKGSVCMYIYEMLEAAGYRTGLYTSPYLEVFNERIQLDHEMISDEDLSTYTDRVMSCVEALKARGEETPTEFEVITAIAFLYYKEKGADYVVLEVGLGGRLDATNIIKAPQISVITSISLDHTERLGGTIGLIAGEKAGIIKPGCPCVTSASSDEALETIRGIAAERHSMLIETSGFPVEITEEKPEGTRFSVCIQGVPFRDLDISMVGRHQVENAVCALTAVCLMEERGAVSVPRDAVYAGLRKAKQIGRFEIMSQDPLVVIDGAHNPDGARTLKNTVLTLCPGKKIQMVTGMLADKDTTAALSEFMQITNDFVVTMPPNPRQMRAEDLAEKLKSMGAETLIFSDYEQAVSAARARADQYDMTLYAGSLYLIGALRHLLH